MGGGGKEEIMMYLSKDIHTHTHTHTNIHTHARTRAATVEDWRSAKADHVHLHFSIIKIKTNFENSWGGPKRGSHFGGPKAVELGA